MTDLDVFLRFKATCPGNKEGFEPSAANRHRWLHHIQAAASCSGFQKIEHDGAALEKIAAARRVTSIGQMPWYAQCRYLRAAACFAGFQVFACGSRVRGDYVDGWDGEEVRRARAAAGKSPKKRSDYDFWVEPGAVQMGELPDGMERVRCKIPESHKIAIPMWDFEKLPEFEHERALELLKNRDFAGLLALHNQYKLSANRYCCDLQPVEKWFLWAKQNGHIQANETQTLAVSGS
jgi:hypothetical protein